MISIHTCEFTMETNSKNFNHLLSCAYKMAKKHHRVGKSTKYSSSDVRVDANLSSKGITMEYHNYEYRKMIKIIANPSKVLGGNDLKIWKPNIYNIENFLDSLNEYITDYFDYDYDINNFALTRIDFTVNLDVGKKKVPEYICLMHKLGKVKGFSSKYSKSDYASGRSNKETSFDLKGKTNNIEFTVYDKEADLIEQNKLELAKKAKGILRIEIRLMKRPAIIKTLSDYTKDNALTAEEEFTILALNCKQIFNEWLVKIIPYGNFYSLKDAQSLIIKSELKKSKKEKMLQLINLIPTKKSFYLANKELHTRNIDALLLCFAALNVSPITISKNKKTTFLPNLYDYFE
ncbi:MAG: hypothetical protein IJO65_05060 [Lachnospiraceae bacterium]|nr:hypothetical protein [Lachnospiraceae bacterium]